MEDANFSERKQECEKWFSGVISIKNPASQEYRIERLCSRQTRMKSSYLLFFRVKPKVVPSPTVLRTLTVC